MCQRWPASYDTHNATMPERAFFKLLVKEGQEQEYIDRHKAVWPEVQADLQGACERVLPCLADDCAAAAAAGSPRSNALPSAAAACSLPVLPPAIGWSA